ncbi:hypothetical protein L484_020037 [Morus notabilis]|uniref:MO25-like protein n=1 Tax=Morus notabilis TaxID=981085 RepID=W9SZX9_9ROSA|nr:putative MO25-like protein At5g47540 [Morus notabilis]EXC34920.1 hypothetical protein L484_020037 [Morus notabilis]
MKGLFKSKPKSPVELVCQARDHLIFFNGNASESPQLKRQEKMHKLGKRIFEIRTVLYGNIGEKEPNKDACAQVTREFFKDDILRLLITCFPKLDSGIRQDATHVVTNLQRQWVNSRLIASEYLEKNLDVMDILILGYEDSDIALSYGAIARECIRHQTVAKYVLESKHMNKFFDYIQDPNFEIASDAATTFRELLTRHKSTVAEFLSKNYHWFFKEYNSKLLSSPCYITKRQSTKLLGDILLDRSNSDVMLRYVSSLDNMKVLMNLLKDSNKTIQLEAFHVFKLFVGNQNKPAEIINVLVTNKSKLLRFFEDFNFDKANEQFEADKAEVIREIGTLGPNDCLRKAIDNCEITC